MEKHAFCMQIKQCKKRAFYKQYVGFDQTHAFIRFQASVGLLLLSYTF